MGEGRWDKRDEGLSMVVAKVVWERCWVSTDRMCKEAIELLDR